MNTRFLFFFIGIAVLVTFGARLLPHSPNFTPVGALALFAGVYLARKHWLGLLLPLLVMFASDLVIGFYDKTLMVVVYISFLGYSIIGMLAAKKFNPATVFLGSIGGAVLFYLTTNFAVWALSSSYPHTFQGLMMCYTLALPFFRSTILGDIFFTGVFFGAYELAKAYASRFFKEKVLAS